MSEGTNGSVLALVQTIWVGLAVLGLVFFRMIEVLNAIVRTNACIADMAIAFAARDKIT